MNEYPDFCPNNGCKQPIVFWTDSGWDNGEFITRYWRGCPNYLKAWTDRDWQEQNKHWSRWITRPWPDVIKVTYEYDHKHVPHLIQRLLGWAIRVESDRGYRA